MVDYLDLDQLLQYASRRCNNDPEFREMIMLDLEFLRNHQVEAMEANKELVNSEWAQRLSVSEVSPEQTSSFWSSVDGTSDHGPKRRHPDLVPARVNNRDSLFATLTDRQVSSLRPPPLLTWIAHLSRKVWAKIGCPDAPLEEWMLQDLLVWAKAAQLSWNDIEFVEDCPQAHEMLYAMRCDRYTVLWSHPYPLFAQLLKEVSAFTARLRWSQPYWENSYSYSYGRMSNSHHWTSRSPPMQRLGSHHRNGQVHQQQNRHSSANSQIAHLVLGSQKARPKTHIQSHEPQPARNHQLPNTNPPEPAPVVGIEEDVNDNEIVLRQEDQEILLQNGHSPGTTVQQSGTASGLNLRLSQPLSVITPLNRQGIRTRDHNSMGMEVDPSTHSQIQFKPADRELSIEHSYSPPDFDGSKALDKLGLSNHAEIQTERTETNTNVSMNQASTGSQHHPHQAFRSSLDSPSYHFRQDRISEVQVHATDGNIEMENGIPSSTLGSGISESFMDISHPQETIKAEESLNLLLQQQKRQRRLIGFNAELPVWGEQDDPVEDEFDQTDSDSEYFEEPDFEEAEEYENIEISDSTGDSFSSSQSLPGSPLPQEMDRKEAAVSYLGHFASASRVVADLERQSPASSINTIDLANWTSTTYDTMGATLSMASSSPESVTRSTGELQIKTGTSTSSPKAYSHPPTKISSHRPEVIPIGQVRKAYVIGSNEEEDAQLDSTLDELARFQHEWVAFQQSKNHRPMSIASGSSGSHRITHLGQGGDSRPDRSQSSAKRSKQVSPVRCDPTGHPIEATFAPNAPSSNSVREYMASVEDSQDFQRTSRRRARPGSQSPASSPKARSNNAQLPFPVYETHVSTDLRSSKATVLGGSWRGSFSANQFRSESSGN